MLSAGPPKPEKLLYSTLHLQTDSSFTGLARRKSGTGYLFTQALPRPSQTRCGGSAVTLPGENSITAGVKYTQRQPCCTVVFLSLTSDVWRAAFQNEIFITGIKRRY